MQLPGSSGQALAHLCIEIHDDHDEVLPPNTVGEITIQAAPRKAARAHRFTPIFGTWAILMKRLRPLVARFSERATSGISMSLATCLYMIDVVPSSCAAENVYPASVERVLLQFLEGIGGASVIGVPDDRLGQRVAAVIEPKPEELFDLGAIRVYCYPNWPATKFRAVAYRALSLETRWAR